MKRTCHIPGCTKKSQGTTCEMHRARIRRWGDPNVASAAEAHALGRTVNQPPSTERQCVKCGHTFKSRSHRTCDKCRGRSDFSKSRTIDCDGCGTTMACRRGTAGPNGGRQCDYCAAFRQAHMMEWLLVAPLPMRQCRHCGTTFQTKNARQVFCRPDCVRDPDRTRTCLHCSITYKPRAKTVGRDEHACSPECDKHVQKAIRHRIKERRRSRKRNAYVADVNRLAIFNRDKWTCQLCGRKVDRKKVAPHPRSPSLDHIVPISRGGTHEPANVQLACFGCNSRKGAKPMGEQLRLVG